MLIIMSENCGSSSLQINSRKRKRALVQPDMVNLTTADQSVQLPVHSLDRHSESLTRLSTYHPWCLPRKRRLPQQLYCCPQQTQPLPGIWNQSLPAQVAQTDAFTSQICFSAISKTPSIFPKNTLASSSSCQQSPCTPASLLRPCHICYRKPTTRELIEAYTDCSICGQRSCYICLRQCEAIDCIGMGHLFEETYSCRGSSIMIHEGNYGIKPCSTQPRKICSRCAVENVTETGIEVVKCLDCARGYTFH